MSTPFRSNTLCVVINAADSKLANRTTLFYFLMDLSPLASNSLQSASVDGALLALAHSMISCFPIPAYCCDKLGAVVSFNDAAEKLWDASLDPNQPGMWSGAKAIFDLEGRFVARSEYPTARAVSTSTDVSAMPFWLERGSGARRLVEIQSTLMRSQDGAVAGVLGMMVDNTERVALEAELRRTDDERSAFLSMLAHELRNPLSPILTAASVMRRMSTDANMTRMAQMVERQVKQLARFVNDLLDASNLASGGIVLKPRHVSLGEVVDCAMEELMPMADARRQKVMLFFEQRTVRLICDPERVSQAISNILNNASAFTAHGGEIAVRVFVSDDMLDIDIVDNGIGLSSEDIGNIFKPYTQFATHADRLKAGAGLGLAIAKNICELHGGTVTATSAGVGHGSRFRLTLPVGQSLLFPPIMLAPSQRRCSSTVASDKGTESKHRVIKFHSLRRHL